MSTIEFVVRDYAGNFDRGSIDTAATGASIALPRGSEVSLNLYPGQIASFARQGETLVVRLANGEVLTVQGYFAADGTQVAQVYVSAGGGLHYVELVPGEGDAYYASFEDTGDFGKFNPDDAFFFLRGPELLADDATLGVGNDDENAGMVGMLVNPLVGGIGAIGPLGWGAAAGGAAVLGQSLGRSSDQDDGGDEQGISTSTETDGGPDVAIGSGTRSTGHLVNAEDMADGLTVTGTGTAGGEITVEVGGQTATTTVDESGAWSVTYEKGTFEDGEYELPATVTITTEKGSAAAQDVVVIDTVTVVTFEAEKVETDGIVNAAERSDGVTLTGTTEAGSTVEVTVSGKSYTAKVEGESWSLDLPAGDVAMGTYELEVTATATDAAGNSATTTGTVQVDTDVPEIPLVSSLDRSSDALRSIGITEAHEGLAVTALHGDGTSEDLGLRARPDPDYAEEMDLVFDTPVPDGSQLVISSTDAAGNQNATLFVLDEAGTDLVDLSAPGLSDFDLGGIDLAFALDSELTLTAEDLAALSKNGNDLTIHGGSDDTVTMTGAEATGDSQAIGDETYDVYTLGDDGGRVLVDEDIVVVT
ncbi:BapA prefix-like domain-containing protein [Histidinibacterium aquaticum]|nr:Ig-like domain-containing protein [Histidinibacterium aquaticum]